jgi:hypothetical protein
MLVYLTLVLHSRPRHGSAHLQVLLQRLLALMPDMHAVASSAQAQFAEWVSIQQHVAVLTALARCVVGAPQFLQPLTLAALDAHGGNAKAALLSWLRRLTVDTSVLCFEVPAVHQARTPGAALVALDLWPFQHVFWSYTAQLD